MIVATGTAHGEAEPDGAGGVDTVDGVFEEEFFHDEPGFRVIAMVTVEAGGDFLIESGVGEEVAGELLDRELVEGLVGVVGIDDPVAPAPHSTGSIVLVAIGIGGRRDGGFFHGEQREKDRVFFDRGCGE